MTLPDTFKPSLQLAIDLNCEQKIAQLNRYKPCHTIDKTDLSTLLRQQGNAEVYSMLIEECPHIFADTVVFISDSTIKKQRYLIATIEKVIALPDYQQHVLTYAPNSAKYTPKAHGVFLGYDFHGSQLIEINTNAGGALLNTLFMQLTDQAMAQNVENSFMAMFHAEWQVERGAQPLRTIAIVDESPETQFLLPEFLLFKQLFQRHDIHAVICDPTELSYRDHAVRYKNQPIDLIYNRLTDFALDAPRQQILRAAYLENAVVVTPHPRAHALYADKRNLAALTDKSLLKKFGVDDESINALIEGIAHTFIVQPIDADMLWAKRKQLFFKPAKGYGSKAVYRGDKLTKRVFEEILASDYSDYVAQTLILPNERIIDNTPLKFDLRHYTYKDQILLTSSRLYQGQTTNFRTVNGGFAQVEVIFGS